jgi:hypothetical protein
MTVYVSACVCPYICTYIYVNMYVYVCMYVYIYTYIHTYKYQNQRTPLHLAAHGGHGKMVKTLVEAKADLCAQDEVSALKETKLGAYRGFRAGTHDTLAR